jgi:hypothetical protein
MLQKVFSDSSQLYIVIPAEAGIQERLLPDFTQNKPCAPGFRRGDKWKHAIRQPV